MATRLTGSLCITDIVEAAKKQHSSMNVSQKNGKLYANITVWLNDEPDQNGNILSIQLNSSQTGEQGDLQKFNGKKVYAGNAKFPKVNNGVGTNPQASGNLDINMSAYGQQAPQQGGGQGFYPAQQGNPWQQQQQNGQQGVNQGLPF